MPKAKTLPDISLLQSILDYDSSNGIFYWKINVGTNKTIGKTAGTINRKGYIVITINGNKYLAHRLAWFFSTGLDPVELQIDHINGVKEDNRLCNLRLATHSSNGCNRGASARNTSGYKGVHYHKNNQKWIASIQINKSRSHIGAFDTPELAHMAYCKAAAELHGEFARGQ